MAKYAHNVHICRRYRSIAKIASCPRGGGHQKQCCFEGYPHWACKDAGCLDRYSAAVDMSGYTAYMHSMYGCRRTCIQLFRSTSFSVWVVSMWTGQVHKQTGWLLWHSGITSMYVYVRPQSFSFLNHAYIYKCHAMNCKRSLWILLLVHGSIQAHCNLIIIYLQIMH